MYTMRKPRKCHHNFFIGTAIIKEQITLVQVLFHYLLRLYLMRFINMRNIVTYNNVLSVQLYKC